MGIRLHDESMRAYDVAAIPGFPLRRPRSSATTAYITHLVAAHDADTAAHRLARLMTSDPSTAPFVAHSIRKHLVSAARLRHREHHRPALALLTHLVRTTPYFYRYIASRKFFNALWNLQKSPAVHSTTRTNVRMLVRAWAEDLAVMFRDRLDPPAAFWIFTYRRLARHTKFPSPPRNRSFVCHVSSAARKPVLPRGFFLSPHDLTASIRLLDQLVSAADNQDKWRSVTSPLCPHLANNNADAPAANSTTSNAASEATDHISLSPAPNNENVADVSNSQSPDPAPFPFQRPQRPPSTREHSCVTNASSQCCPKLNEKMLSVLRRYDNAFGRTDPYEYSLVNKIRTDSGGWSSDPLFEDSERTLTNVASSRASRSTVSSSLMSVAAIARENARRKLNESQASLSVSYNADRSSVEEIEREDFVGGQPSSLEGGHTSSSATTTIPAVTPSTFAQLDVSDTTALLATEDEEEYSETMESVGDTIKLPGMMVVQPGDGNMNGTGVQIDTKILKLMSAAATAGVSPTPHLGQSQQSADAPSPSKRE